MLEAATEENLDVDRLSFTGCLRILQRVYQSATVPRRSSWSDGIGCCWRKWSKSAVEPRQNRVNPRVVKRKMSKFAKKRPEHHGRPPLKKNFAETVVIT